MEYGIPIFCLVLAVILFVVNMVYFFKEHRYVVMGLHSKKRLWWNGFSMITIAFLVGMAILYIFLIQKQLR